ncbi:MAG: hypothetical protein IJY38_01005, partial [Clostridia bacterium]|nr:hypothetical protein [Clostridia bacterium]
MSIFKKFALKKRNAISLALASVSLATACSLTACFNGNNFQTDADMNEVAGAVNTMIETPTDGTNPSDYDPKQNAFYAAWAMNELDGFVGHSEGETITKVAVANVSQKIKSHRVVYGEEVYKESISHSTFKGVGSRRFVSGDNYIIQDASKVNNVNEVTWEDTASKISEDAYIEKFGYVSDAITAYIMTEETILSAEYLGEEDGLYCYRYELDPVKSTTRLLLEMRTMAGTKSFPIFERAAVEIKMDALWRVAETRTDCVYQVDMLGGVTCTEDVTEVFSNYNEGIEPPNAEFYRSYMDAEVSDEMPENPTALDYLMNGFSDYITGQKPLKVGLDVDMAGETPLSVKAKAEIDINMDDLSKLGVKAEIEKIAFGDLCLNDLYIGYKNEVAYDKFGDLKAKGEISEVTALLGRLLPAFGLDLSSLGDTFSSFDVTTLLAGATLTQGEEVSTVFLPLTLGDVTLNATLNFNEGETVTFASATATIGDVCLTLTPDDNMKVADIGTGYRILTPIFDVIDENGDVNLNLTLGETKVLTSLHLADLSADLSVGDVTAKYKDETVYLSYKGLNVKLNFADITPTLDKLLPILEGKVDLPDINAIAESIDVLALLTQVGNNLSLIEKDNVLTISTSVEGATVAIKLDVTNNGYTYGFNSIEATFGDLTAKITSTDEPFPVISNDSLSSYYNIVSLLDIIDANNEINLQATVSNLLDTPLTIDLSV